MFDRPMLHRILGAVAANGFARLMRIAEQLLLIPLLLAAWGVDRYGEWIALTSLAMFATFANLGVGHAAGSDIVLRHAGGDVHGAARSNFTALAVLTLLIGAGLACVVSLTQLDIGRWVSLRSVTVDDARWIIVLTSLAALVIFYAEPLGGAVGAMVGARAPNLLIGVAKAVEIVAIAIALRWHATPRDVAAIMLAAAVLNVAMHTAVALRVAPWLSWSPQDFDLGMLRRTWRPSLGFFLLYTGVNVVNIQAPRLIVYHYLGAATLVAFTVLATYTKTARNLAAMMSQAAQVEIGRAYAGGGVQLATSLVHNVIAMTVMAGFVLLAAEMALAPLIVPLWTHGQVAVQWDILATLAVVALVGTYFDAALLATSALNKVLLAGLGYWIGLAAGLSLALVLLPPLGVVAVTGIGLLLPELAGSIAATRSLDAVLHRPIRLQEVLSPGWLVRLGRRKSPKV
jgi:O-antigen/teichoic acid export membrane protein